MLLLLQVSTSVGQTFVDFPTIQPHLSADSTLLNDLQLQDVMRTLRRMKRSVPKNYSAPIVVVQASQNETGKCVISADQAVHYCGFAEEVTSPPIPPPLAGSCHTSESGREICYPKYEELDTSCTDVSGGQKHGLVAPPVIPHATVQAMAFVPPDNLRRLIRQFYRQQGQSVPKDMKFTLKSFLFVKYHCEFGYELVDEIDTMFCQNKQWVLTEPVCRGKGLCEVNNGGCSHSCLSFDNRTVECRCPKGMILDTDKKTCIKPIPKNLCRDLAGCSCSSIDDVQYSCTCLQGEKCLLLKGPPKIYLDPPPPHEILPGGNLNVTCRAVAYPFPQIYWQRENEEVHRTPPKPGTVKSEQILMIRELFHSTTFTCHADNDLGSTQRSIHVVVKGITFN
uniref:protein-tyrosine-phosphatase n=1 Tax=Acrobeloides nanus TaxID=290746 RepID=A0A914EG12_9BILA